MSDMQSANSGADPCEVNGSQEVADTITSQYVRYATNTSDALVKGNVTVEQWHQSMKDLIRLAFTHQAVAGTPDADARQITDSDKARIQDDIGKQYEYLDGFAQDVENAASNGSDMGFVANRAALYPQASEAEYWRQALNVDLPAVPRDGSTRCLSRCQCNWQLDCDPNGDVRATWVLGDADHCDDCVQRSQDWAPLLIPAKGK